MYPLTHGIYGSLLVCPGSSRGSFLVRAGLPAVALAEKLLSCPLCQYKSTYCLLYAAAWTDHLVNQIILAIAVAIASIQNSHTPEVISSILQRRSSIKRSVTGKEGEKLQAGSNPAKKIWIYVVSESFVGQDMDVLAP